MIKWLATFFVIWFIYHVRTVFPPFIIGGIIAYLLLPVVQQLSANLKVSKTQAVGVLYLNFAILLGLACWSFLPSVLEQFGEMANRRTDIVEDIVRQAVSTFDWTLDVNQVSNQIVGSIEENVGRPEELMHISGLVTHGVLSLLVCTLSSIYFIIDSERVAAFGLRFVPQEHHKVVRELSGQMNRMLSRYVRGQLILIIIMSTVAWLFLHYIVHLRYALPIAIVSGFLEIIPVLGPIVATTIASLVGFAQYDVVWALGIIVFYTAARWTEDYLIIPKVIGHAVELHPLIIIFAVLCGEVMAGALGMLIAIPVAASVKVIIDFTHPEYVHAVAEENRKEKQNG